MKGRLGQGAHVEGGGRDKGAPADPGLSAVSLPLRWAFAMDR